jgi:hypothetical protein
MTIEPLAGSPDAQIAELAAQHIEQLVRALLVGRKIDGVRFVDQLLAIVRQVGEIHCCAAGDQGLRFELPSRKPFEVALDGSRGKLRMLCARLAVLCQENGHDCTVYGGEGTIRREFESNSVSWSVLWYNTPDRHEFTIQAN